MGQTMDYREWPGGFGWGSGTVAHWIQANMDADARKESEAAQAAQLGFVLPLGWSFDPSSGVPVSPWAAGLVGAWRPRVAPKSAACCSVTGRPALVVGSAAIELECTIPPHIPASGSPGRSPQSAPSPSFRLPLTPR